MRKTLVITALAFALVAIAPAAFGATSVPANLPISANVAANCTISTGAVAFGAYDPLGANASAPLNASGSVTITCTRNTAATVGLDLGKNPNVAIRQMQGGTLTNLLAYELYQPPNTTPGQLCTTYTGTVWGTGGANLFTPVAAPSKTPRTFNICGTIAGNLDPAVDNYTDTVVASVNF